MKKAILASLVSCAFLIGQDKAAQSQTALETFYLRGVCQKLGEALNGEILAGNHWVASFGTNYRSSDRRCYVTLIRLTSYLGTLDGMSCVHKSIYDGQTKELLAYLEKGKSCPTDFRQPYAQVEIGLIFDNSVDGALFKTFEETIEYINSKMLRD